jgi:hypothetical protein
MQTREIYSSPNGDRWFLVRATASEPVSVRHEPNLPSGGRPESIDLGTFLRSGAAGPEHQALMHLIGSLLDEETSAEPALTGSAGQATA